MRQFFIILRYTFLNKRNRRQKSHFKVLDNPIYAILPGLIFGSVIGVLLYISFVKVNIQIPFSSTPNVTFLDIIFIVWSLGMSVMFIFSYAPFISINLFENDDIPFLLTFPVRKIGIFAISSIESLIMAGIPIFMIFPLIIDYALIKNTGILFPLLSIFGFTIFLLAISNLLGMLISQFISKTSSKILATILYFFMMIFIIIMYNILSPKFFTNEVISTIMVKFERWVSMLTSPYLFTTWILKSTQGSIMYTIILYITSILLLYFTYLISKKLDFSISRGKKKVERTISTKGYSGFPFLKKDLKILFRDPQSIYIILYTLGFPFLMAFINRDIYSLVIFQIMISALYAAIIPVSLLRDEKNALPLGFNLPIEKMRIVTPKIYLSVLLFSLIFIFSLFVSYFLFYKSFLVFLIIPFIIFGLFYESFYGVYLFFKNPTRETSRKMVLTGSEMLFIEGLGIGMSAIIILLFSYISSMAHIPIAKNFFLSNPTNKWVIILIGGITLFMLIVPYDMIRVWEKIKSAVIKWE